MSTPKTIELSVSMPKFKDRVAAFLEKRGGSWSNYLRRQTWYVIPFGLVLNVLSDLTKYNGDSSTPFPESMWIPLAVTGSFLLLSQTAATLASSKDDEMREAYNAIAHHSFSISMYVLPVGWMLVTCWKLIHAEANIWTYLAAPFYTSFAIGCALNFLDIYRSLETIMQACIRLNLFDRRD